MCVDTPHLGNECMHTVYSCMRRVGALMYGMLHPFNSTLAMLAFNSRHVMQTCKSSHSCFHELSYTACHACFINTLKWHTMHASIHDHPRVAENSFFLAPQIADFALAPCSAIFTIRLTPGEGEGERGTGGGGKEEEWHSLLLLSEQGRTRVLQTGEEITEISATTGL